MTDAAEKRQQVADHIFLDVNGNPTKDIAEAVGYRYVDKASGELIEVSWLDASDDSRRMGWLFGMKTKATNEASQWRQKDAKGEIDAEDGSQVDQIRDTFDLIDKGVWREKVEGRGVGAKVDCDVLAACVVDVMKVGSNGQPLDYGVIRERLGITGADGKIVGRDQKFFRAVREHEAVKAEYNARKGITPKAAPDLGSML